LYEDERDIAEKCECTETGRCGEPAFIDGLRNGLEFPLLRDGVVPVLDVEGKRVWDRRRDTLGANYMTHEMVSMIYITVLVARKTYVGTEIVC
jgi:hypothetical protein